MKLALIQLEGKNIADCKEAEKNILVTIEEAGQSDSELILLPECSYPGYLIGDAPDDEWRRASDCFLVEVGALAAKFGKYLAVGVAFPHRGELYNSLILFGRRGETLARWDKSNLWHFDDSWFAAGCEYPVVETEFGPIGGIVCADGRIPEISRILALRGARLILDSANLVASAFTPEQLLNQQYAFMLRTRAAENGTYIAVCNKCGVEDGAVTMAGRSFVVNPFGDIIAEAGPSAQEILYCEIDMESTRPPLPERRPALYGMLAAPTERLPVVAERGRTRPFAELERYVALARFCSTERAEWLAKARVFIRKGMMLRARLILLPPFSHEGTREEILTLCGELGEGVAAATCCEADGIHRAVFFNCDGLAGELCETHAPGANDGIRTFSLWEGINVAAVFGEEMCVPEIARVATLQGADILLWFDSSARRNAFQTLRTRAAENKIFTTRLSSAKGDDRCILVNPDGNMICTTYATDGHVASGMINTALSRCKTVTPGTDIIAGRIPHAYVSLTE